MRIFVQINTNTFQGLWLNEIVKLIKLTMTNESKYSRKDEVKFVETAFKKF